MFRTLLTIASVSTLLLLGAFVYKLDREDKQANALIEQQLQEKNRIEQEKQRLKREKLQRKNAIEQEVKNLVAAMVKDSASVQFRKMIIALNMPEKEINTQANQDSYIDAVCGEFNAKNSDGGYVGFKPFIWKSNKENPMLGTHINEGVSGVLQELVIEECSWVKDYVETHS